MRCLIVVFALLAACARRPPAPVPPVAAGDVREATLQNGFLSVRIERPPGATGPRPVVISLLGEHEPLLAAGVVVATYSIRWELLKAFAPPPAPPPSTSVGTWLLAAPTPKTVGRGYFRIIAANTHAVSVVLGWLTTLPEVDPTRIGIAGTSTNGFVALEAAADPRITAAAVIAACGDYHGFLARSSLAMNGRPLDLDPTYDAELRHQEPLRRPGALTHAAVLMVNGADDPAIPASCAGATARLLAAAYRRAGVPDRFSFTLVPGAGHNDLAARARDETLVWFRRWLIDR